MVGERIRSGALVLMLTPYWPGLRRCRSSIHTVGCWRSKTARLSTTQQLGCRMAWVYSRPLS